MSTNDLKSNSSSVDQLQSYLKLKGRNHNCYKTYGELKNIVRIRDELSLVLSKGEDWNDITDRNNFNSATYDCVNFGKCFSFSQDENVAMWMLYGGLKKSGGMIDFTKKGINSILAVQSIDLGYFCDNTFCTERVLESKEFDIFITDILYYKENALGFFVKRSDETIESISKDIFNKITVSKKAYPWNYENECRLIISINKELLMSKIGFINDVVRGIKKIVVKEQVPQSNNVVIAERSVTHSETTPLLKRIELFLEDGEFDRADDFCEQVLNIDPENGTAYLDKLLVEFRCKDRTELSKQAKPFDSSKNYNKVLRFGSNEEIAFVNEALKTIKKRLTEEEERQRKELEEQRKQQIENCIDPTFPTDDDYVDIKCPHCGEELSFTTWAIEEGDLICPWCDKKIIYSENILR